MRDLRAWTFIACTEFSTNPEPAETRTRNILLSRGLPRYRASCIQFYNAPPSLHSFDVVLQTFASIRYLDESSHVNRGESANSSVVRR